MMIIRLMSDESELATAGLLAWVLLRLLVPECLMMILLASCFFVEKQSSRHEHANIM
jgi:hypothetical protein